MVESCINNIPKIDATAVPKLPVGFQGVPGAYSHVALEQHFDRNTVEEKSYPLFEDVVQAVVEGEILYGVLPIENSSTGGITEVYDLVRRYGVFIVGEEVVKVEHNLLALPGARLEDIKEVYSHPQGFAQCGAFFRSHPEMEQIPYFNTARSAEMVANSGRRDIAAVAGSQAAERYGLEILVAAINRNSHNYTRFIVIASSPQTSSKADKITVVVSLKHEPGALYRMLGFFQRSGLNLLNIESRPIENKPWEYFFHLDVSGNLGDPTVISTLKEVEEASSECRVLGNYRRAI